MNRHFEKKECFSAANCKVLCELLTEAKISVYVVQRLITSMPMFPRYRVKVEIIIFPTF